MYVARNFVILLTSYDVVFIRRQRQNSSLSVNRTSEIMLLYALLWFLFFSHGFVQIFFSAVSEIWKDKSWGNLFGSAFFLGVDKCKFILDIVSKYLSSQVRIWSSSFFESYSFSCNNKCSSSPFILLILFSIDVFIVFKRIIVSKLLSTNR